MPLHRECWKVVSLTDVSCYVMPIGSKEDCLEIISGREDKREVLGRTSWENSAVLLVSLGLIPTAATIVWLDWGWECCLR